MIWWLAGCSPSIEQEPVAVLESFRFDWERFNHRVSHLEIGASVDAAQVSIIGGTSTTGVVPDPLPDECSTCNEFPFLDYSLVEVGVRVLESDRVALVPATLTLEVGRDGATGTLRGALPKGVDGEGAVLLSGFSLDTSPELSGGPSCYDPAFGWHPSRLVVDLGAVTVEDDAATAPVTLAFSAGNTHDPDRVCIDEVNDQAVVDMTVSAVFVVGKKLETADVPFVVEEEYAFSGSPTDPGEQPEPPDQQVEYGLSEAPLATGIARMEWVFYPDLYDAGDDEQGAYLRTLAFGATPDGAVNATSTNFSVGTQLEGFAYRTEAVARAVFFEGSSTSWTAEGRFDTLLEDGVPVVHTLEP